MRAAAIDIGKPANIACAIGRPALSGNGLDERVDELARTLTDQR